PACDTSSSGLPASSRYFLSVQETTRAPRLVRRTTASGVSTTTSSSRSAWTRWRAGTSGSARADAPPPVAGPAPTPDRLGEVDAEPGAVDPGAAEPAPAEACGDAPGEAPVCAAGALPAAGSGFFAGCGGKMVHQTIRNPTERTMNRTVRR